jgi:hypothetical protein
MYGLYVPILVLQAFCVYHAYRNNAEQRWYWLIIFFPLIGCIIYMAHNFNDRATLQSLTENVKEVVISNYRLEQLEKALGFSDNVRNKINLADAYIENGRFQDAINLYSGCLQGFMSDDPFVRMKLLNAHFMNGEYDTAVEYGNNLESEKSFKNSEERVTYAWSLFQTGEADMAESIFADMDRSYTNYYQRSEYCKFLLKREKSEFAKDKLTDLLEEFDQMQGIERHLKKNIHREVRGLYANHFRRV